MAVLKEFRCKAHNHEFETRTDGDEIPECPYGCDPAFVVREFRTAPNSPSPRTRVIDHFQRQVASDYGMTDMRGDKDGSSVMSNTHVRSGGGKVFNDEQRAKWAPSLFQPQRGWATTEESAPPVYKHDLPGNTTKMQPILKAAPPLYSKTVMVKQKGEK